MVNHLLVIKLMICYALYVLTTGKVNYISSIKRLMSAIIKLLRIALTVFLIKLVHRDSTWLCCIQYAGCFLLKHYYNPTIYDDPLTCLNGSTVDISFLLRF
jgi:hypothetical protein